MDTILGRAYTYKEEDFDFNKQFVDARIAFLKRYILAWKPKKILELGCGNGRFSHELSKLCGATVYGIEVSDSGIKTARAHGIIVKKADLNKTVPFENNTFDLVISDQLIEHIVKTDVLLGESKRVLKKGGRMVIITPNLSFWFNRILFLFGEYPLFLEVSDISKVYGTRILRNLMREPEAMGHVRVFNLPALTDLIEASGFTIEESFGLPLSWNLPKVLKAMYDAIDCLASLKTSLSRDIGIIAVKR
ncbi:MAG TPA: methyltransferase domain-containing protein [Patescibacteria group bacterium]|nr:methyltransferase domain-containing protein [Patescibacteria group bacterium]